MLYKLSGLPSEDEIVLCKVTKIFPNAVFVQLVEYGDSGMIHISEVSPGRIRNLRDYVSEGRQIVCKVLRVNKEKGHIDLSLRRVNSHQRREKLDDIKAELKAEQMLKIVAKKVDQPLDKLYKEVAATAFKQYSFLYKCFKDAAEGEVDLLDLGLKKEVAEEILELAKEKFKPQKITIEGKIHLETYLPEGVEKIKKTLTTVEKVSETIKVTYLGAGKYKLVIEDFDYKPAEKHLGQVEGILSKFSDKQSVASFERQ
jgi:translation initiation factor 2 subunit 1